MKQRLIDDVVGEMLPFLNNAQAERLQEVLIHTLWKKDDERNRIIACYSR